MNESTGQRGNLVEGAKIQRVQFYLPVFPLAYWMTLRRSPTPWVSASIHSVTDLWNLLQLWIVTVLGFNFSLGYPISTLGKIKCNDDLVHETILPRLWATELCYLQGLGTLYSFGVPNGHPCSVPYYGRQQERGQAFLQQPPMKG